MPDTLTAAARFAPQAASIPAGAQSRSEPPGTRSAGTARVAQIDPARLELAPLPPSTVSGGRAALPAGHVPGAKGRSADAVRSCVALSDGTTVDFTSVETLPVE